MALPIVQKVGKASKESWPQVQSAVASTMRSMQELAGISDAVLPQVEEYISKASGPVRRRKICEETIWVLANLGWLRTGSERDAILAAKVYADVASDQSASDDEYEAAADELITVIRNLPDFITHP